MCKETILNKKNDELEVINKTFKLETYNCENKVV